MWYSDGGLTGLEQSRTASLTRLAPCGREKAGKLAELGTSELPPSVSPAAQSQGARTSSMAVLGSQRGRSNSRNQRLPVSQASGLKTGTASLLPTSVGRSGHRSLHSDPRGVGIHPSFSWGLSQNLWPSLFTPAHCKYSTVHKLRETVDDEV